MKNTVKAASKSAAKDETFSAEEKAAMREYAAEKKAARSGKVDGESDVVAKIAAMKGSDRAMAEKIHALVKANAPGLTPRLWYGMPAYARDDKVVCFFQDAAKFKARYATLGFSDKAALDDGGMWASSFALMEIGSAEEAKIAALLKKAVG